jgi:phage repressor protein C with HTH and peptisase S24 domain
MDKDHSKIWAAIDGIAKLNGISVSRLARTAGLDATAFNKSKRAYPSGKLRWPSTESITKVIKSVSMDWNDFLKLVEKP